MKRAIIYFSYSNNTKHLVETINKEFNYDIYRIDRKVPYSSDYNTCAYIEAKEEYEKCLYPEIKDDIDYNKIKENYDEILLFFPIWWYTFPLVIATFITKIKGYKGKVIFFANSYTNDHQYMVNSLSDFNKVDPNIAYVEGLFNKSEEEHISYLKGDNK